jgi:hypothetical protein
MEFNTNLPPTALAHKIVSELLFLASMLYPDEQRILKKFCDVILQNRAAVSDATHLLPLEAALVVIQVDEHKKNRHEFSELYNQLQTLRHEIGELKERLNEQT